MNAPNGVDLLDEPAAQQRVAVRGVGYRLAEERAPDEC